MSTDICSVFAVGNGMGAADPPSRRFLHEGHGVARLTPQILEELERRNPMEGGRRKGAASPMVDRRCWTPGTRAASARCRHANASVEKSKSVQVNA